MAYSFVTVTGTYTDETGTAVSGIVEFSPSVPIVDPVAHVTIAADTQDIALTNGSFSISLLAMDNTNLNYFVWVFRPHIENIPSDPQYLSVFFANGATQDITVVPSAPNPFGG